MFACAASPKSDATGDFSDHSLAILFFGNPVETIPRTRTLTLSGDRKARSVLLASELHVSWQEVCCCEQGTLP